MSYVELINKNKITVLSENAQLDIDVTNDSLRFTMEYFDEYGIWDLQIPIEQLSNFKELVKQL